MNKQDFTKKVWIRPEIHTLSIKKDTFSGSGTGAEKAGKVGPPRRNSPAAFQLSLLYYLLPPCDFIVILLVST